MTSASRPCPASEPADSLAARKRPPHTAIVEARLLLPKKFARPTPRGIGYFFFFLAAFFVAFFFVAIVNSSFLVNLLPRRLFELPHLPNILDEQHV
jgi:hypothetical protein